MHNLARAEVPHMMKRCIKVEDDKIFLVCLLEIKVCINQNGNDDMNRVVLQWIACDTSIIGNGY